MKLLKITLEEKCEIYALDFYTDDFYCCYKFKA